MESKYLGELKRQREKLLDDLQELRAGLSDLNCEIAEFEFKAASAGSIRAPTKKNLRQLRFIGLIRQILSQEDRAAGLKSREIYDLLVEDYADLKYSSLRSYVRQMKENGQLYQRLRGAPWQLSELKE